MGEVIDLCFKYTEEEYVAAMRQYMMHNPRFWVRLVVISFWFALGIFLTFVTGLNSDFPFTLALSGPYLALIFILSLFVMPLRSFRRDPKVRDEYLLQFSDEGVRFKTPQINALLQWSLYTKVLESSRFYIMVYEENGIYIIPKRAFASAAQQEAFDELLKRRIPARTQLKSLKKQKSELIKPYTPPAEPPDWR